MTLRNYPLSVVIPVYNEADSVEPLIHRLTVALADYPAPWEALFVDDGSIDDTVARLTELRGKFGSHIRIIPLQRNFGQTAAMQAGIDHARGTIIATMDGDLQNDPVDIPRMARRLIDDDLDLLAGWRKDRKDKLFLRKIPSRIANRLIRRGTGVHIHDYGCSLKLYRASLIKRVRLYGEMHRFIPAWAAMATSPSRIGEEVVTHHARQFGSTKYGISRTFRVILDLVSVYFFMRFRARPGHFFGAIGLTAGAISGAILAYLAVIKFVLGQNIGTRPLLLVGVVLAIAAVQFVTTGIVAEMMARTYFESSNVKPYLIREGDGAEAHDSDPWHTPAA